MKSFLEDKIERYLNQKRGVVLFLGLIFLVSLAVGALSVRLVEAQYLEELEHLFKTFFPYFSPRGLP